MSICSQKSTDSEFVIMKEWFIQNKKESIELFYDLNEKSVKFYTNYNSIKHFL